MSSISQIGTLMKLSFEHYDYGLDLYKDTELRGSFIVERDGRISPTRKQVVLACFLLLSRHSSGETGEMHENTRGRMAGSANTMSGHYCCVNVVSNMYEFEATSRSCNEVFIHYLVWPLGVRFFYVAEN